MLGAIIGDIVGSIYEFNNIKREDFPFFGTGCFFTDDTVLTVAQADAILSGKSFVRLLKEYYYRYPGRGYGGRFDNWASSPDLAPYNSFGNGSAMRVSPVGFACDRLDEVLERARESAAATHSHPEGIKGAQATAAAIFMARTGTDRQGIREYVEQTFGYDLSRTLDEIRPGYDFNETCQDTVPQAITAFLESSSFEDAIRKAISLGGDSDTLACITGGIAQAFYGEIPLDMRTHALDLLDGHCRKITMRFAEKFGVAW